MKDSALKLEQFLKSEYIDNPGMGSETMDIAIRDLLTDLMHVGDEHGVYIESRLDDAQEVYEEEALLEDLG